MKYHLQTVAFFVLVFGGCRAEPSRPEASSEASPAAPPAAPAAPPAATAAQTPSEEPKGSQVVETFDGNTADAAPRGFSFARTGKGAPGQWLVKAEAGAPSGANVLAQVDADNTNSRFPIAVLDAPVLK